MALDDKLLLGKICGLILMIELWFRKKSNYTATDTGCLSLCIPDKYIHVRTSIILHGEQITIEMSIESIERGPLFLWSHYHIKLRTREVLARLVVIATWRLSCQYILLAHSKM